MKDYIDYLENNSNEDLIEWLEERGVYIEIISRNKRFFWK